MRCEVCGGTGFVKAAPISTYSPTHARWGRQLGRVAMWAHAVIVPCFNCGGGNAR